MQKTLAGVKNVISSTRKTRIPGLCIFIIAIVVLVIFIVINFPQETIIHNNDENMLTVDTYPTSIPTSIKNYTPASNEQVEAKSSSPFDETEGLQIHIVNALQDKVEEGWIQIDNEKFAFKDGLWQNKNNFLHKPLTVQAPPYSLKTLKINDPKIHEITAELDYTYSIECHAVNGNPTTVVELWEGCDAERPSSGEAVILASINGKPCELKCTVDNHNIFVKYDADPDTFTGNALPFQGDSLCWIGEFNVNKQYPHLKANSFSKMILRDSLLCLAKLGQIQNTMLRDSLVFDHEGGHIITPIFGPNIDLSKKRKISEKRLQNGNTCRFEQLKPGAYSIRAVSGKMASRHEIAYPAKAIMNLKMIESAEIGVYVQREGVGIDNLSYLSGVTVSLISQTKGGVFYAKTGLLGGSGRERGLAGFKNVPLGMYTLKAESPDFTTTSKTVTVDEEKEHFTITVNGLNKHIAGTVLRLDTKVPVAGIPLQLIRKSSKDFRENTFGIYKEVATDLKGCFLFEDVVPGDYQIRLGDTSLSELNGKGLTLPQKPAITMQDKDIDNLEIILAVEQKIVFKGRVLAENGEPAAGAVVYVNNNDVIFEDRRTVANNQGEFLLTLISNPKKINSFEIFAVQQDNLDDTKYMKYSASSGRLSFGVMRVPESGGLVNGFGKTVVSFHQKESIEGIVIQLKSDFGMKQLKGKVLCSENIGYQAVFIIAKQNGEYIYGNMLNDGAYCLDCLQPGPFLLSLRASLPDPRNPDYNYYHPVFLELNMDDDAKSMEYDITLVRSSYLSGVINIHGVPLKSGCITARSPNMRCPNGNNDERDLVEGKTDSNGNFWIGDLYPDREYQLVILDEKTNKPVYTSPLLKSGSDNVFLDMN